MSGEPKSKPENKTGAGAMAPAPATVDPRQWLNFINLVRLQNLILLDIEAHKTTAPPKSTGQVLLDPHSTFGSALNNHDPEKREFTAIFDYRFSAVESGTTQEVATVALKYALFYAVEPGPKYDEQVVKEFVRVNACFHAWPFARSLVHSTTMNMGLPAYFLGPLLVGPGAPDVPDTARLAK